MQTDALIGIQDMGAAGLTCSTTEMGSRGGAGIEIDVVARPAARDRHDALRDHALRIAGAHAARRRSRGARPKSSAIFEKWDLHAVRIGPSSNDGMLRVTASRRRGRGDSQSRADRRSPGLSTVRWRRPATWPRRSGWTSRHVASARRGSRRATCCMRLLANPNDGQQAVGLPAVRPHGPDQHREPARRGRRRRAHQGDGSGAGDVARRQRSLLPARSEARRDAGGRGSRAQRRLLRRAAAGDHQLPEFWQSRAAGDHVAVRQGGRRTSATPAARSTCRSPVATSVSTTRPMAVRSSPTPIIGVVGLLDHVDRVLTGRFQRTGDLIVLFGESRGELGGSEYLAQVHGLVRGVPPVARSGGGEGAAGICSFVWRPSAWFTRRTTARTEVSRSRSLRAASAPRDRGGNRH